MNENRDRLAADIATATSQWVTPLEQGETETLAMELDAMNWEKREIIKTQEQADAVREGTVVIDSYRPDFKGDVYRASLTPYRGSPITWWQAGPQTCFKSVQLPALVLLQGTGPTLAELKQAMGIMTKGKIQ
ncbi:hypothetical protein SEA_CONBOY_57 [Arthrobacter phage Conboy]|uniref:Uncharacterized protein n=1 Tax=Arthrobacter phage Conboy TaxID=1873902 RepID=A0A1B1SG53_9CAUD|nr:hypothetical protein SEA_CONBOY_57 [Arthrobacter phage Conboy]